MITILPEDRRNQELGLGLGSAIGSIGQAYGARRNREDQRNAMIQSLEPQIGRRQAEALANMPNPQLQQTYLRELMRPQVAQGSQMQPGQRQRTAAEIKDELSQTRENKEIIDSSQKEIEEIDYLLNLIDSGKVQWGTIKGRMPYSFLSEESQLFDKGIKELAIRQIGGSVNLGQLTNEKLKLIEGSIASRLNDENVAREMLSTRKLSKQKELIKAKERKKARDEYSRGSLGENWEEVALQRAEPKIQKIDQKIMSRFEKTAKQIGNEVVKELKKENYVDTQKKKDIGDAQTEEIIKERPEGLATDILQTGPQDTDFYKQQAERAIAQAYENMPWHQRQVPRLAARAGEAVAGLPGDIASLAGTVGNLVSGGNLPTYEDVQEKLPISLPTSSQIREGLTKRITGEALEPKNWVESLADDVVGDFATMTGLGLKAPAMMGKVGKLLFPGMPDNLLTKQLSNPVVQSIISNFIKVGGESVGGKAFGESLKLGSLLGMNFLGGITQVKKDAGSVFNKGKKILRDPSMPRVEETKRINNIMSDIKDRMTSSIKEGDRSKLNNLVKSLEGSFERNPKEVAKEASRIRNAISNLEQSLPKAKTSNAVDKITKNISMLKEELKDTLYNPIKPNKLYDIKESINSLWSDLPSSGITKELFEDAKKGVKDTLYGYLDNIDMKPLAESLQKADAIYTGANAKGFIKNLIEKTPFVGKYALHPAAKTLILGTTGISSGPLTALTLGGVYGIDQAIAYLGTNKEFRNALLAFYRAGFNNSKSGMLRASQGMNEALKKEK